jgi:hypothetical protein
MDNKKIKSYLEIIDQQVNSSILGGMELDYEELESLGYVKINRDSVQHAATLTPLGLSHLAELRHGN